MARSINNVEMPSDVTSGEPFDVTVTYTSTGSMTIEYSGAFRGKPESVPLPAGGQKTFRMTITRVVGPPPKACRVVFTFGNTVVKLPRVS